MNKKYFLLLFVAQRALCQEGRMFRESVRKRVRATDEVILSMSQLQLRSNATVMEPGQTPRSFYEEEFRREFATNDDFRYLFTRNHESVKRGIAEQNEWELDDWKEIPDEMHNSFIGGLYMLCSDEERDIMAKEMLQDEIFYQKRGIESLSRFRAALQCDFFPIDSAVFSQGENLLMKAVREGSLEHVHILLEHGASPATSLSNDTVGVINWMVSGQPSDSFDRERFVQIREALLHRDSSL